MRRLRAYVGLYAEVPCRDTLELTAPVTCSSDPAFRSLTVPVPVPGASESCTRSAGRGITR